MIDIKRIKKNNDPTINISRSWYFFTCFLQNSGLRITESRKIIFTHIICKDSHFTAEQVARELSHGSERVSRATVYVTLELIMRSGMIRSIPNIDKHRHYEVNSSKVMHQHMKCCKCGKIFEFNCEEFDSIIKKYSDQHSFQTISANLVISGLCIECKLKLL